MANYKRPKGDERDEQGERKELPLVGCAPTTPSGSDEESGEENIVLETKKKKKKKEKSKKRAKENKKSKKDQVEERKRRISPASLESKELKIAKVEKEFDDRMNKKTSEMDRDRKRYNDDQGEGNKLDKYRRPEHKDRDRGPVRDDDKYRGNIDGRNREYIKHNERDRGKVRDADKKRYENKNRK